jgi:hypothetical protein
MSIVVLPLLIPEAKSVSPDVYINAQVPPAVRKGFRGYCQAVLSRYSRGY